jgi:hypothetical protein
MLESKSARMKQRYLKLINCFWKILNCLGLVQNRILEEQVNAEAAWADGIETYAQMLESMENEYFAARAADVRDVGRRVIRLLMGMPEDDLNCSSKSIRSLSHVTLLPRILCVWIKSWCLPYVLQKADPPLIPPFSPRAWGYRLSLAQGKALLDIRKGRSFAR